MSKASDILNLIPKESPLSELYAHSLLLDIHARALAAHCECLALNAANCRAMVENIPVPYNEGDYYAVLQKWNICNDKGEPLI